MTKKQETAEAGESLAAQVIDRLPDWITHLIQINSLIANRMGVVATDFHCLHVLQQDGATTAGVLAGRVGLTPGAASRMIDRLADAGCVKRVPDPHDRRRILIEPTDEGLDRIYAYYAGLTARTHADLAAFDDQQLRTLLRFIELSQISAIAEVGRLRATGGVRTVPGSSVKQIHAPVRVADVVLAATPKHRKGPSTTTPPLH